MANIFNLCNIQYNTRLKPRNIVVTFPFELRNAATHRAVYLAVL